MTRTTLSEPRKNLIDLMQRLKFGRIERLVVRDGEPVLDPAPRIVRDIKIGGEKGSSHELDNQDFALRSQEVEMLEHLSRLRDGTLDVVEVKHGLPFKLVIEQPAF
jgi:hypothetical protein